MNLKYEKKNSYEEINKTNEEAMFDYADEYIRFLNFAKTEYKCVEYFKIALDDAGFKDINKIEDKLTKGDKVYYINKDRSIYVAIIGEKSIVDGMQIIGGHIDSPRLDTKPMPLFEKQSMALLKTQYYGGIKKYQWLAIPLSMYAVIYNEKGERIEVVIGEKNDEPCFTITDLLPHLSKDQLKETADNFINPENLSVVIGSIPDKDEKDNKIKMAILKLLNKKYGIKEIDFARSDIRFVPSFKAKYIGFDKGLIAGYGQDDRVCSYATIKAMIDLANNNKDIDKTIIAAIVDKEEIGSVGNTSMESKAFDLFTSELLKRTENNESGLDLLKAYSNSKMISADVASAVEPMYEDVSDLQNANVLGCGICVEKYTGSGGKSSASEASAEYMSYIMKLYDDNDIKYQIGTLGKIGKGGGGTIAYILANKGIEIIDSGTSLLGMHSPYEVSSTIDVYMTYKAYKAFFVGK